MTTTTASDDHVIGNVTSPVDYTTFAYAAQLPRQSIAFLTYYYGLLGLLTVVNLAGNAGVMTCLLRHRHLRVPGNYFIFSLACSDFCLGLIYPVYNVSHIELPQVNGVLGKWN